MRWPTLLGVTLLALFALFPAPSSASNTLYGVFFDLTATDEQLGSVAPATGIFTPIGPGIAACCFIPSGVSTFDPDNDVFYFVGRFNADIDERIFGIDAVTGLVASSPLLPSGFNYNFIELDPSSGTLYAVIKDTGPADSEGLAIVDPVTGGLTPLGAGISACCFIPSGVSAIDPLGQVFYFVGRYDAEPSSVSRIFGLDLATGALLTDPVLPANRNYNFLGFDPSPAPGTLLTVSFDVGSATEQLGAVNPTTGGLAGLGAGLASCCLLGSGVSALDPNGDVFYFVAEYQGDTGRRIFALDSVTGALVSDPHLSAPFNYNFIAFDPTAPGPQADLAITKDDGLTLVQAGGGTTYSIVVTNLGPDPVSGATVLDAFPADVTCSWSCAPDPGAACTAGPVLGDISDSADLPAGASVTYTASCTVASTASGTLSNTASVSAPMGVSDPDPSNDEATDTTDVNRPPVASCQDVTVPVGPACTAPASVDDGSFDPDGDPITLTPSPAGPYGVGMTVVTLLVEDDRGGSASCDGTVTVTDDDPPTVSCNAPATVVPPDAPIAFQATATDTCGPATAVVTGFDCFKFTNRGRRVDKTSSCVVSIAGDTITILDSGGVGDTITWTVTASDGGGNEVEVECSVAVVNPGQGNGAP